MQGELASFFGSAHNERYTALLKQVSDLAIVAARHLRETGGQDLPSIIEYEHKADRIVDDIHELLDNSFIMRFDITDAMRLADDLGDVVDCMRKVALLVDGYKKLLTKMPPEAIELMALAE
jgi:uncharacterized protein Yka (UPF0111/DUF47 family)